MNVYRAIFFPDLRFSDAGEAAIDASGIHPRDLYWAGVLIRSGERTAEQTMAGYVAAWPAHEQGWRDVVAALAASA